MTKRRAVLVAATLSLVVGSSALSSHTFGSIRLAGMSPPAVAPLPPAHFAHARAQYVDLYGNLDESNTICLIVNRSHSSTIYLGEVFALGPDGLSDVLAVHDGSNGAGIPPLGSLELPVDSVQFPGLLPKTAVDSRGVESGLVGWSGPKDALRLVARIHLEQPGTNHNRVVNYVEGHYVTK